MIIQTDFIYPPIPDRRFDWVAYIDPEGANGFGPSERSAVSDLLMELDLAEPWEVEIAAAVCPVFRLIVGG